MLPALIFSFLLATGAAIPVSSARAQIGEASAKGAGAKAPDDATAKATTKAIAEDAASVEALAREQAADLAAGLKLEKEDWTVMYMQGNRSGFGRTAYYTRQTADGIQHVTKSHEEFRALRMGISLHNVSKSQVVEDDEGVIISFSSSEAGSGSNKETSGVRVGEELVVRTNTVKKKRIAMPRSILGPRKVDQTLRALDIQPGLKKTLTTFVAQFPEKPIDMKLDVVGKEEKSVRDGAPPIPVWHIKMEMSFLPGIILDTYADMKLDMQLGIMRMPGIGEMRVVTCTRAEALEKLVGSEMMVASFIHPDKPLTNYRKMKSATFRITTKDEGLETRTTMGWADGGNQKVISKKPGETVLQINVPQFDEKAVTWKLPYAGDDKELKECLAATQYVEITPLIEELAKKAVGDEKNPVVAARKIDAFVRRYITGKNFSVGFASADETARSKVGDCTEHGVLCAALARAVGLPSRVVTGLGYLPTDYEAKGEDGKNGTFGFHMWAEAWVGPTADDWIPMDAALGSFDIGHLAITRTALTSLNPMTDVGVPIINMMGNLKIEVVELQPR